MYVSDRPSKYCEGYGSMERLPCDWLCSNWPVQKVQEVPHTAPECRRQPPGTWSSVGSEMRDVQIATIGRRLNTLEQRLAGRAFMMGERFTVADAYLFTVLNWTRLHRIDVSQWPNIQNYMARVGERESVRKAMIEEGLTTQ